MKYSTRKKQNAFTLLEILVALSIAALIMSAVYGSYRATTKSILHCKPKSIVEQEARLFLQRFTSELRCSYAGTINSFSEKPIEYALTNEMNMGSFQKKESPLFTSEEVSRGNVFLQFVTSSFTSSPYLNIGGLAVVSYKLDNSGKVLLRNVRNYIKGYEQDGSDLKWQPVLSNVKNITCEYLEDDKWKEDWKSTETKVLPKAVKVSLVLDDGQTGPITFESSANIMCGRFQNSESTVRAIAAASNY
ncbi:MAG: prepilin-type N-terminal cleavage/methylation domain-containing protein [Sedimentisphaerales bacterium]|nr:prepilin-type N-terminal cleavage/methylation domain-containing protein [Sedimentisphaerales bacterium]